MRLAVDAMGGDNAPDEVVKGCLDALGDLHAGDRLVLVGRRRDIEEILAERGFGCNGHAGDPRIEIHDASDVIDMHESPVDAVRQKTDSSMVRMALLGSVKAEQRCDVVLSAGNTGACVSAATMHMKRLPGVHRPGIAIPIPSFGSSHHVVLCDGGANPQPRPSHLWQYGLMAEVFSRKAFGTASPRVAMMNIGSEEGKGTGLIKETHELLKTTPGMDYIGFIEGRDFFEGMADVVVTDGFTGNTILKTAEGLAKAMFRSVAEALFEHDADLAMQLQPFFKGFYAKKDYHELGGAPLLGVNGNCVIAHGSSEARTIRSCIRTCREMVDCHVNDEIVERLAEVEAGRASAPA